MLRIRFGVRGGGDLGIRGGTRHAGVTIGHVNSDAPVAESEERQRTVSKNKNQGGKIKYPRTFSFVFPPQDHKPSPPIKYRRDRTPLGGFAAENGKFGGPMPLDDDLLDDRPISSTVVPLERLSGEGLRLARHGLSSSSHKLHI